MNDNVQHDPRIDDALGTLNHAHVPQHLAHRVHARIAREPLGRVENRGGLGGVLPWATLMAVAAGLVLAVIVHPAPHTAPGMGAIPAPAPVAARTEAPAQPSRDVHPSLVAEQRHGRGAALNANGAIATARAQSQHRQDQLEAEQDAAKGLRRRNNMSQAKNDAPTPPEATTAP